MSDGNGDLPTVGTFTTERGIPAAKRPSRFSAPARRFGAEIFRRRRERLATVLKKGVCLFFGAKSTLDTWEERRFDPTFRITGFRQEPNLFYLTGLEIPGATATLDCHTGQPQVFVAEPDDEWIQFELDRLELGTPMPLNALDDRLGELVRHRVVYLVTRSPKVASLRAGFGERSAYPTLLPGGLPDTFPDEQITARVKQRYDPGEVRSLVPFLQDLRRTKDASELETIQAAADATVAGFRAGIQAVGPGVEELEVAAELQAGARQQGAQRDAFTPVIQSGADGLLSFVDVVDAYDGLNRRLEAGELTMLDYGAELDYYVADLARTVPVSGRFSDDQRTAYEAYLRAYDAGIDALGPGRPFMDAAQATAQAFEAMLPDLPAWLRPAAETFASSADDLRPGHFLGLELHDHERYREPLQPGEVVAYEHHFRVPERNWRITVEDMLLVTEDGCEILTKRLPREADAIEALMATGEQV